MGWYFTKSFVKWHSEMLFHLCLWEKHSYFLRCYTGELETSALSCNKINLEYPPITSHPSGPVVRRNIYHFYLRRYFTLCVNNYVFRNLYGDNFTAQNVWEQWVTREHGYRQWESPCYCGFGTRKSWNGNHRVSVVSEKAYLQFKRYSPCISTVVSDRCWIWVKPNE
jgi:hypothetical protein